MKTLHTLELAQDGLTVKATQRYKHSYNGGHWNYVITYGDGHIVYVGQSSGPPPRGKLTIGDLADMIKDAVRSLDDEDRELYGIKK